MGTRPISRRPGRNKKAPRGGLLDDHPVPGDRNRASLPGIRWLSPSPRPARMIPQPPGIRSTRGWRAHPTLAPAIDSREPPEVPVKSTLASRTPCSWPSAQGSSRLTLPAPNSMPRPRRSRVAGHRMAPRLPSATRNSRTARSARPPRSPSTCGRSGSRCAPGSPTPASSPSSRAGCPGRRSCCAPTWTRCRSRRRPTCRSARRRPASFAAARSASCTPAVTTPTRRS